MVKKRCLFQVVQAEVLLCERVEKNQRNEVIRKMVSMLADSQKEMC